MFNGIGVALVAGALTAAVPSVQTKKPAAPKTTMHDLTVKADAVYTGTMELAIVKGKVTGTMHLMKPTEIKGTVAGTSKKGVLKLEFPYQMTERKCDGTVKMNLTVPPKPGPTTGTMEAVGCGRDTSRPLTGTVEMTPRKK